jgi:hypothetical protein
MTSFDRIYSDPHPTIGVVVGTFAAVPYVHLHLESWRRHYPSVRLLVNDDASPFGKRLAELCAHYGADFASNARRGRRTVGDLSAYTRGLEWAEPLGVDILVKMSRRFIPLCDWVPGLQKIAFESQMATFSQICEHFSFGFRTECIGFHCATWRAPAAFDPIRRLVDANEPVFVEGFIHQIARDVAARDACAAAKAYMQAHPRLPDRNGYAPWELMSDRRVTRRDDLLWHDAAEEWDYWRAASTLGLDYSVEDFADPNQGCGVGRE